MLLVKNTNYCVDKLLAFWVFCLILFEFRPRTRNQAPKTRERRPMHGGQVPMFKMKPLKGPLWAAIAILLFGVACYFNGHSDPGDIPAQERSNATLTVCIVVGGILFIISTGRMWFKHLWHDRYK
jgi:hypothetical protein